MTNSPQAHQGLSAKIYGALPYLLLICLVVSALYFGVRINREQERLLAEKQAMGAMERPPANVIVQSLVPMPIQDRLNLPGLVEAWQDLELLAEARGMVLETQVGDGDRVVQGQVIVRLDDRDYQNSLNAITASYDLAVSSRDRLAGLRRQNLVPQADFDRVEAEVKSLLAQKEIAALQLSRCLIRAPISGVVNKVLAKKGRLLASGDPVARIIDLSRVKITVGIPESDVTAVRSLDSFTVTIDALDGRKFTANKHFLAVVTDSMAQLYRLELELDNDTSSNGLLPGMFARVEIVKQHVDDALAVPLYSIISRDDRNFVYVVDQGVAKRREVRLGILDGWLMQIVSGLDPGEQVVIVGHRSVDDGQKLQVVQTVTDPREIVR